MKLCELKPTTFFIGEKAQRLFKMMSAENKMGSRLFFTKLLIREARAEATALPADKLKERLALIEEVNDELIYLINNPPKTILADREYTHNPKRVYQKIWEAHRRLKGRGFSEKEIHEYCLDMYGLDIDPQKTPTKSPKRNPNWVGGGPVAQKIKQARENSKGIEVEGGE